jgi:hypothetical protein
VQMAAEAGMVDAVKRGPKGIGENSGRIEKEECVQPQLNLLGERGLDEPRPLVADGGPRYRAQVATPLRIV